MTIPVLLFIMLLLVPCASADTNGSVFDILDEEVFTGNWSSLVANNTIQHRCNFPAQWYLITGVGLYYIDSDTYVGIRGLHCSRCRSRRGPNSIGSCPVYNYSDWCGKISVPYVVTNRVWNAQPSDTKNVLNNTTRFMGVVPDAWYNWHPYMGCPNRVPANVVTKTDHIFGWVNVTFENASMINGTMYVADSSGIVPVYDVWNSVDGIKAYERCEDCLSCKYMHATLINMTETVSITETGDNVKVVIDAVLNWGYYCSNCWPMERPCRDMWINTTEHATFVAIAERPTCLTRPTINCTAHITFYNDSRTPIAFVYTDLPPPSIVKITYTYNGSIAEKYIFGIFRNNCIEFLSDMPVWCITKEQSELSRRGDLVLVRGRFDQNKFNISMSTPYYKYYIYNYTMDTITPKKPRVGILTAVLLIIGSSVLVIITIVGAIRREQ